MNGRDPPFCSEAALYVGTMPGACPRPGGDQNACHGTRTSTRHCPYALGLVLVEIRTLVTGPGQAQGIVPTHGASSRWSSTSLPQDQDKHKALSLRTGPRPGGALHPCHRTRTSTRHCPYARFASRFFLCKHLGRTPFIVTPCNNISQALH